ncbi:MAG TPA: ABC transporter ATP-binding protein [Actinobacteria bacterium]|nr:ABC transporter ATP-binding protein [Actinomycetota bacterium]
MEKVISAEKIAYSYNKKLAVDHISFHIDKCEILGFLGPNGAGKTTTLKMLIGLLIPQDGKISILGMDTAKELNKIQAQIGVCFEEKNLYEEMSAVENLKFFASLFGVKKLDVVALLEKVNLPVDKRQKVASFSKGMKQRLMMARSLVNQPKVLFLDEPTDGLDPVSARAVRDVILKEKEKGATIFLTTHDMLEADKLSDRVAFINEGKISVIDTPENLKHEHGKRILKVRYRLDGEVKEEELSLEDKDMSKRIDEINSKHSILDMHTEEATLEDIFIKFTGRKLEG